MVRGALHAESKQRLPFLVQCDLVTLQVMSRAQPYIACLPIVVCVYCLYICVVCGVSHPVCLSLIDLRLCVCLTLIGPETCTRACNWCEHVWNMCSFGRPCCRCCHSAGTLLTSLSLQITLRGLQLCSEFPQA
jgi:hypothetical protein